MNPVLISVIVPVYNAENYIAQCVTSILKQTYTNFELLLIVDGATDGSLRICRELQTQDKRIVVVDKPNEGVSATRNLGITMAKGEYICFVDADDRISEDYLEVLLEAVTAEQAQIALCQYAFERKDGIVPSGEQELTSYHRGTDDLYQTYIRSIYRIDGAGYILGSACRSIFQKKLLTNNEIHFPPCKLFEDQLFVLSAMACSDRIAAVNKVMYYYNDTVSESAVRKPYKKNLLTDQLMYLTHLEQLLPTLPITACERNTVHEYSILNARKLLLTNAAMHCDTRERKAEIGKIRNSSVFEDKIPLAVYWKWLRSQPIKTILAELLIQLRMYGLLKKLRSK